MISIENISDQISIDRINSLIVELEDKFNGVFKEDYNLTRKVVSFQANKQLPVYRWYKYKEAFSAEIVHYLFDKYDIENGKILDPFAGVGTALFASSDRGNNAYGIELLPIGQEIIKTRLYFAKNLQITEIDRLRYWCSAKPWETSPQKKDFVVLKITNGAYAKETDEKIKLYLGAISKESPQVKQILFFALLCVLEAISYTRKDGQYLRWDYRSNKTNGKGAFDKGEVLNFDDAIVSKLKEILQDIENTNKPADLFAMKSDDNGEIILYDSSCLDQLPKLADNVFSAVITSPPYCNRYDYTRTYALELAMLGVNETDLRQLRQKMLSCTVENKEKDMLGINPNWDIPLAIASKQELLSEILTYLEYLKTEGKLNNNGIARMIKGYFYEMACVIYECHRVLKNNGYFFMVNDNVKYAGVSIPVDTILSDIACSLGFEVKDILVLPSGKGNSSQQMGRHGREDLRKCVYVWQKRGL
jgi:DNA modification methylase